MTTNGETTVKWDGEAGEMAIALKGEGLTASEIADRLAKHFRTEVTRSMVLGHFHRNGLCVKRLRGRPGAGGLTTKMRRCKAPGRLPMVGPPMPRADDIARVTFDELEDHHCRFIPDDPTTLRGQKMFCGLPRHPGLAYCDGHAARCMPTMSEPVSPDVGTPVEREVECV